MHNKVKSEQCFAVTSAKKVAFFQLNYKLRGEEAGTQLSSKDNKHLTSHILTHLCEETHCTKKTLI